MRRTRHFLDHIAVTLVRNNLGGRRLVRVMGENLTVVRLMSHNCKSRSLWERNKLQVMFEILI